MPNYGTVEVQPNFTTKKGLTLIVNVYQAAILECFNDIDEMTLKEI